MVTPILPARLSAAEVRMRGTQVLGPMDLDLAETGTTVVLGPNGAGKTTLLRLLHGLQRQSRGGQSWAVPSDQARRAQGFIFQHPVVMRRDVLGNITYPLRLRGVARAQAIAQARDWAGRCGIGDHLDQPASSLSGGERQKLALARALVTAPQMLLCDEPTAHLDGAATKDVEVILTQAAADGTRIVIATHDLGQARRLATDAVLLHHGKIVETGPAPDFFDAPETDQARAFLNGDILT